MKTSKILQSTIQLGLILGLIGIILILADTFSDSTGIITILRICFLIAFIAIPIYLLKKILDSYSSYYKNRFIYYLLIFLTAHSLIFAFNLAFYNYFFPEYKVIYAEKKTQNTRDRIEEVEAKNSLTIENKESSLQKRQEEITKKFESAKMTKDYAKTVAINLFLALALSAFYKNSSKEE
ncbi:DUF4199 family protein [Aquirufa antheringensis]|uniref:DUF4199 family protein n=1 Tax=Aquirufa antheringensis TaxID=2516559 RepID=UPI0022A846C8|nr:DUF4199 family protein [Aquirufa antheringensis]MCZ2478588.1 DUF4199 family protein [Aquirufa antheringensis]